MIRVPLSTGVELDVAVAGEPGSPTMICLHGFPESHRTWRHQAAAFARDFHVIAPDQRGYARSDKPQEVEAYAADRIVADLIALADHFDAARFTLVAHDWGGAVAWLAALRHPDRIVRLVILNAPHPLLFQRSLFDDPQQRAGSQYIRSFRDPALETRIDAMGLERFFDGSFAPHVDAAAVAGERERYLEEWRQPGALTGMLNWYRASGIIVPAMDEAPDRPAWLDAPFPSIKVPTLVIWGMRDKALQPVQIEGLEELVDDLTVVPVEDAGHFVPWERPEAVNAAMREWLASHAA
ncbi:alpha/beta hydrolase [Sphingomonas spermidinifaciens]|uniref:Alpha/beta hydrolase n=1 Tax=Sphingomonas spermidinifaciens TaxID=1141889 RepID=A0A2A4B9G3_9SPHN|nr:alpha/beta hydrolase [Sphingomonas spermidinifaciens]PCD04565.1 alpha/beta hydrolase [Sphingomonas spermidinifaciens]